MAISTYDELKTSVASWLKRSDLTALIPDFITLAEDRMNRALRVRQMEAALASTAITDNRIAVPTGTVGVKTLWTDGYENSPLLARSYESLLTDGTEGVPTGWAWQGDYFYFDGSGDVSGVLYTKIPALSSLQATNWLLTAHPSAYLFGALAEAHAYTRNPEAAAWKDRFEGALSDLDGGDMRDRFGSGPLVTRAR